MSNTSKINRIRSKKNSKTLFFAANIKCKTKQLSGPARANVELIKYIKRIKEKNIAVFDSKHQFLEALVELIRSGHERNNIHFGDQSYQSFFLAVLCVLFRVRYSTTAHGYRREQIQYNKNSYFGFIFMQEFVFVHAHTVVFVGQPMITRIPDRLMNQIPKYIIIPNGSSCVDTLEKSSCKIHTNGGSSYLELSFVGGDRGVKALEDLLNAMWELKNINIRLNIFGFMRERIHDSRIQENHCVKYNGSVSQEVLFNYIKQSDGFVQCSRFEPFGMAALDAFILGTPVIVSRECGVAEEFKSLATRCRYVKLHSASVVHEIAECLQDLYDAKKERYVEAVDREELNKFSWYCTAEKYQENDII